MLLLFLRSAQQRLPAEELLNLASASYRNKKKEVPEYFSLFHHFQLMFLLLKHIHPPPVVFLLEEATGPRLKREHGYINCPTKVTKLDLEP